MAEKQQKVTCKVCKEDKTPYSCRSCYDDADVAAMHLKNIAELHLDGLRCCAERLAEAVAKVLIYDPPTIGMKTELAHSRDELMLSIRRSRG